MKKLILIVALAASPILAAVDANKHFDALVLKDGRTLKNVTFVIYSTNVVMAKWDGGRGTIVYDQIADSVLKEIAPLIPKNSDSPRLNEPFVASLPAPTRSYHVPPQAILVVSNEIKAAEIIAGIPKLDTSTVSSQPRETGRKMEIGGQCFITTKGGNSIKLGGVDICVYSESEFTLYSNAIFDRDRARQKATSSAMEQLSALGAYSQDSEMLTQSISDDFQRWLALPPPAAVAKTDADGRFSFSHNVKPPYVIFARARRSVINNVEYYVWRVSSEKISMPNQIFLSNDNML